MRTIKVTYLALIFILLIHTNAIADTIVFNHVECSSINISTNDVKPSGYESSDYKTEEIEVPNTQRYDITNYRWYNDGTKYKIPQVDNIEYEYKGRHVNGSSTREVTLYSKLSLADNKLYLVVTTSNYNSTWFIGSALSGYDKNKCFVADATDNMIKNAKSEISKKALEQAKVKVETERKVMSDAISKKKWAEGE